MTKLYLLLLNFMMTDVSIQSDHTNLQLLVDYF